METCKNCQCFNEFKENSPTKSILKLDGFCEYLECGVVADELPCKHYVEKEND